MNQKSNSSRLKILAWLAFGIFTAWWLYIYIALRPADPSSLHNQIFGATYGILSVIGGIIGLVASRKWGGGKSLVGRALIFFALGLFAQEFGQLAYSYYTYVLKVEIPYPSWGDLGYFGSVLLYIYAALLLARTAGVKFSLKNSTKKIVAIALPLTLLVGSYAYFLRGYVFDFSSFISGLTVVLDLGYPLGQAVYIAIALLTYLLSKGLLGGIMKNKILLVLFALLVQYIADFAFLNAARAGTAYPGGINDFLYLLSYLVMALALNTFRTGLPNSKMEQEKS